MKQFEFMITAEQDISATLREGLKECSSLRASRKAWAILLQSLGVSVCDYLLREQDESKLCTQAAIEEIVIEGDNTWLSRGREHRATGIFRDGVVSLVTPNGVKVMLTPKAQGLLIAVEFRRESVKLATMMLAGFAHRVPDAYPLLAKAAAELAATTAK